MSKLHQIRSEGREPLDFTLTINCGNAAFEDRNAELARILREFADKLERGVDNGTLRDFNGNVVGIAYIE